VTGQVHDNRLPVVVTRDGNFEPVDILCLRKPLAGQSRHEYFQFVGSSVIRNLRKRLGERGVGIAQCESTIGKGAARQDIRSMGFRVRNRQGLGRKNGRTELANRNIGEARCDWSRTAVDFRDCRQVAAHAVTE